MCELGYQNTHTQQKTVVVCDKTEQSFKKQAGGKAFIWSFYTEDKFGMVTKE